MGFKATEAVEELAYDFHPHADASGVIPEPTTKQVETFRNVIFGEVKNLAAALGMNFEEEGGGKLTLDKFDTLMEKSSEVEALTVDAVADLTGLSNHLLNGLPYRIKAAFVGWIVGQFLNPEA